jgi:hypothetical protein
MAVLGNPIELKWGSTESPGVLVPWYGACDCATVSYEPLATGLEACEQKMHDWYKGQRTQASLEDFAGWCIHPSVYLCPGTTDGRLAACVWHTEKKRHPKAPVCVHEVSINSKKSGNSVTNTLE